MGELVFSEGCCSARMLLCICVHLVHKQKVIICYVFFSFCKIAVSVNGSFFFWTDRETVNCVVAGSFSPLLPFIGSTVYLAVAVLWLSLA